MFAPDLTLPALRHMKARFGDRLYGRYGFADAFHPTANWINPDVIGIDLGITLLSAENLRSGNVWRWFMANPEITTAMQRAGFTPADGGIRRRGLGPIARSTSSSPLRRRPSCVRPGRPRPRCPRAWPTGSRPRPSPRRTASTLPYRLLPPPTPPPPGTRVPLVLVLHGSGEIGTDNRAQLTPLALAWARDEARARDGAFVVVPQMPGANRSTYSGPATGDARTSEGTAAGARDAGAPRLARRRRCRSIGSASRSSASRWARRRPGTCCTRGRDSSPPPCRSPACRAPTRRRRRTRRRGSG